MSSFSRTTSLLSIEVLDLLLDVGHELIAGRSVHQAMRAAKMLEDQEEISAEVIDLRTIRPLDIDTVITSVKKTNRAVIVEDDWLFGGFGGELSAQIMERAFDWLDAPVARVSCKDVPLPYNRNLEFAALPSEEDVVEAVLRMFKE